MGNWRVWIWVVWVLGLLVFPRQWGPWALTGYVAAGAVLGVATGVVRFPGGLPWQRAALRKRLATEPLGSLPDEVRAQPPRRDLFTGQGHLRDASVCARWLPLLLNGQAARALVLRRTEKRADGNITATIEYAWLSADDHVCVETLSESYTPEEIRHAPGNRRVVVDVDAGVMEGSALTVLYDRASGRHIILEALLATGWSAHA